MTSAEVEAFKQAMMKNKPKEDCMKNSFGTSKLVQQKHVFKIINLKCKNKSYFFKYSKIEKESFWYFIIYIQATKNR